jgi:hypothetical protein
MVPARHFNGECWKHLPPLLKIAAHCLLLLRLSVWVGCAVGAGRIVGFARARV